MLGLGSEPILKPKTQRDPDSEFNYVHFGIEINRCLKFLRPKSFLVQKFLNFFETSYKNFKSLKFFDFYTKMHVSLGFGFGFGFGSYVCNVCIKEINLNKCNHIGIFL